MARRTWYGFRSRRPRGGVAVEFAMVVPILVIFLFGVIEFGLIFKDLLVLNQAAREAARAGALGSSTTAMVAAMTTSASTLTTGSITYYLERGVYSSGTWTYTTLTDTGSPAVNSAATGDYIRVRLTYPHTLVTGKLFSRIANAQNGTAVGLSASTVMRRE
jgi:Flp pilus assembly protein TadG